MNSSHNLAAAASATAGGIGLVSYRPLVVGTLWALLTVLVWGAWPSFTRLAVTQALTAQDLVLLRYGIGGFILLPVLVRQAARMPRSGWREGVALAAFQGAPLALLTTAGVRFAPASHMSALSPGLLPLFAAFIGFMFFRERLSALRVAGLTFIGLGALAMAGVSLSTLSSGYWRGDIMFACAGLMGAIYAVRMRRSGLSALQGAALISVYSLLFYVPLYLWLWVGSTRLTQAPLDEVMFQALYQGVLMGVVTMFSLSRAIVLLGASRGAAFLSLIPVLGTVIGAVILHEIPPTLEIVAVIAISLGALLATGALDRART